MVRVVSLLSIYIIMFDFEIPHKYLNIYWRTTLYFYNPDKFIKHSKR